MATEFHNLKTKMSVNTLVTVMCKVGPNVFCLAHKNSLWFILSFPYTSQYTII